MTNKHDQLPVSSARIILFGGEGGFSQPVLKQLLTRGLNVVGLVIVEPLLKHTFPVGVRQSTTPDTLEALAAKNKIALIKTPELRDATFLRKLFEIRGDIILIACFGHKIPARIWQKMKLPCWNLHPSLLPAYRGPDPLYWQLNNHEPDTGLTLHEVIGDIDAGDILAQEKLALPENHDQGSLNVWVSVNGVNLFYKTLVQYLRGELKPAPQDEMLSSYFPAPGCGTSSS